MSTTPQNNKRPRLPPDIPESNTVFHEIIYLLKWNAHFKCVLQVCRPVRSPVRFVRFREWLWPWIHFFRVIGSQAVSWDRLPVQWDSGLGATPPGRSGLKYTITVARWLALLSRSKKVPGSSPVSPCVPQLVRQTCVWINWFLPWL